MALASDATIWSAINGNAVMDRWSNHRTQPGAYTHRRRVGDVPSAEEFYKNADEHLEWADSAKTEHERTIFLQMAAAWLVVAQGWEAPAGRADNESEASAPRFLRCGRATTTVRPALWYVSCALDDAM
jgi:hypothetical protein